VPSRFITTGVSPSLRSSRNWASMVWRGAGPPREGCPSPLGVAAIRYLTIPLMPDEPISDKKCNCNVSLKQRRGQPCYRSSSWIDDGCRHSGATRISMNGNSGRLDRMSCNSCAPETSNMLTLA
jgi:hypothetical protein